MLQPGAITSAHASQDHISLFREHTTLEAVYWWDLMDERERECQQVPLADIAVSQGVSRAA